ncbi:mycothiol transferase [Terrabacter sp. 2RAF25]|uniref:mycothiol transferase n=1 Tax=Terrabacter sp. 2RAF25 TaxID=3232998 RepID=UPI003F951504
MDDVTTYPARDLLLDGFGRIRDGVPEVVDGLSAEELLWRPDRDANHIAWLVWHLARQQDDQVAHLAGADASVWTGDGWVERFGLPYPPDAHGWSMSSADVGRFTVADARLFAAYQGAVHERTVAYVEGLEATAYARVIDRHWDPPVTVGVRIVSVLDDAAKHLGQAEYVRGLVQRRR